MQKKIIGEYLAPEIEEITLETAGVIAVSGPMGEDGQPGSDIFETNPWTL